MSKPAAPPAPPAQAKGLSAQSAGAKAPSPLMAKEAGNAVTSAVADVVNQTAAPFQNLKKPADVFEAFSQAQAVVGAVAGLANAPTEFLNNAFARATNGIAKALPSFDAATIGSLAGTCLAASHCVGPFLGPDAESFFHRSSTRSLLIT